MALGKAYITVHADTRPFGRELKGELEKHLAAADKQMAAGGQKAGKSWTDGATGEIRKGAKDLGREFDKLEPVVRRSVRKSAKAIDNEFGKGFKDAERGVQRAFSLIGNTMLSFFSSSLKNGKDWANGISGLLSGAGESLGSSLSMVIGIAALVFAALSAGIPLIVSAATAFALLGAAAASVALAFAPLLVVFKELAPILPALGAAQDKWNKAFKQLNPVLRPLALVLREIALTFKKLPIGDLLKGLLGPLKAFEGFISSKAFRKAWIDLGKDAAMFFGAITAAFQNKAGREAFTAWVKETGDILRVFGPAVGKVLGAFVTVFNNPAFQHAVGSIATIISELVVQFADWLTQASNSGALDTFLSNVLMIFQDLMNILPAVGAFLAPFLTPGAFAALDSLLKSLAFNLRVIGALLSTKEGQRTVHDFSVALESLAFGVGALIFLFVALDTTARAVISFFRKVPGWIKSAWGGIAGFFKGLWHSIGVGLDNFFNSIIDGLNGLIRQLNKLPGVSISQLGHVHFTSVVDNSGKSGKGAGGGGGSGGSHGIFASANGNYFDRPSLTTVGEGWKPEVVIPLTKPARARALADKTGLTSMLTGDRGIGDIYVFVGNEPVDARVERAMDRTARNLTTGPRA